ncbi:MAG TPA: hypothetical protein VEQ37_01330 [Actinomycetota bacterium]|nr:hypothetical protein [Actinomycetota bacterium]
MLILVQLLVEPPRVEVVLRRVLDAMTMLKMLDEGGPPGQCVGDMPAFRLWSWVGGVTVQTHTSF